MEKSYIEKIQPLFANEEFEAKFKAIDDPTKFAELFEEYGVTLSNEEMADFIASANKEKAGELDPEDLDKVSGGAFDPISASLKALGWTWQYACKTFGSPQRATQMILLYWKCKLTGQKVPAAFYN